MCTKQDRCEANREDALTSMDREVSRASKKNFKKGSEVESYLDPTELNAEGGNSYGI